MSNSLFSFPFPAQFAVDINELEVSLPETALEISAHLTLGSLQKNMWAWYEISGAVLSHYLVDREARLAKLIDWFYRDLGFTASDDYYGYRAAELGYCLLHRRGNSTALAMILMLLARQLDLTLEPVLLPGHTLLRCQRNNQTAYLDPLTGQWVQLPFIHALVRGELGNGAPLKTAWLQPVNDKRLLTRLMHELKAGCIVLGEFELALSCCNLLQQWHGDDMQLLRERAYVAEQLGCLTLAATDLQQFVEQNPHDPMIDVVRMQLQELSASDEVFH